MTRKSFSGVLLRILILILTAALIPVLILTLTLPGIPEKNSVLGHSVYLPEDHNSPYTGTAVFTEKSGSYAVGELVLFQSPGGIISARIEEAGDVYYLSAEDTGDFFAASPEEILGKVTVSSARAGKFLRFAQKHPESVRNRSYLICAGILLVQALLITCFVLIGKKKTPVRGNTPKVVEEQMEHRPESREMLTGEEREKQISAFMELHSAPFDLHPAPKQPLSEEEKEAEDIRRMMAQETKVITFEKQEEPAPEAETAKAAETIPEETEEPSAPPSAESGRKNASFTDLQKELDSMLEHLLTQQPEDRN